MNKIVCDVCGTSYPETAVQCPICGTAKTDSAKTTTGGESGYAYVKGGRFSHANVRKRNAGKKELPRVVAPVKPEKEAEPKPVKEAEPKPRKETAQSAPKREQPGEKKQDAPVRRKPNKEKSERGTNIVLAVIALLLVLAIIAVFAYIVKGYIDSRNEPSEPVGSSSSTQSVPSTPAEIFCTGIRLALSEKKFTSVGDKFQLNPIPSPAETTDTVWYESGNELIATVDEKGIVTAVANGEVTIYVHCGEYTAECYITCEVGVEPTDPNQPTEPPTTVPTEPPVELKLNREEFTLRGYGSVWDLYDGEIDPSEILWTSSDEAIATVEKGKVTAVGNGDVTITAEYMGQKVTCKVHCEDVVVSEYKLEPDYGYGNDYTIKVGRSVTLYLIEKETGARIKTDELTFTVSKEGIVSIDENGKVTALARGTVYVTVTYGDQSFKAVIRVTNPET